MSHEASSSWNIADHSHNVPVGLHAPCLGCRFDPRQKERNANNSETRRTVALTPCEYARLRNVARETTSPTPGTGFIEPVKHNWNVQFETQRKSVLHDAPPSMECPHMIDAGTTYTVSAPAVSYVTTQARRPQVVIRCCAGELKVIHRDGEEFPYARVK